MKQIFFILLLLAAPGAFAKKAKSTLTADKALRLMQEQSDLDSLIKFMQAQMGKEDGDFMKKAFVASKRDLTKPYEIKVLKNKAVVNHLGVVEFRMNGNEATYHNQVIRLNKKWGYKQNVLNTAKLLRQAHGQHAMLEWLIPSAHAKDAGALCGNPDHAFDQDPNDACAIRQANDVVAMLTYVRNTMGDPTAEAQARLLANPDFKNRLEKSKKQFQLEKILTSCTGEQKGIIVFMVDGSVVNYSLKPGQPLSVDVSAETDFRAVSKSENPKITDAKYVKSVTDTINTMCAEEPQSGTGQITAYSTYWKGYADSFDHSGNSAQ